MKLFALLASAIGLTHAAEDVWQDVSDADARVWKNDVLHASSTMKQIKNKSCKLPNGKSLKKLGNPTKVRVVHKQINNITIMNPMFMNEK